MKQFVEQLERRSLLSASGGWYTVDDFQYPPSSPKGAAATAMAKDAVGDLFAVGNVVDTSGQTHNIVREKLVGSTVWNTVYDYIYAAGYQRSSFLAATVAPDGTLYVAGQGQNAGGTHWIVLSAAPGAQLSLIENMQLAAGDTATAYALACDSSGNVFVVGTAFGPSLQRNGKTGIAQYWLVQEKPAGQTAFQTVDQFDHAGGDSAQGVNIVPSGPAAGIYAVGNISGDTNWLVRKSSDGGATWSTVDNFNYAGSLTGAYGIVGDNQGNLFVSGSGRTPTQPAHWLVRESSNGGASWSTVDDWQLAAGKGSDPTDGAIGLDAAGNVFVGGFGIDTSGVYHAILRSNAGGSWNVADNYELSANEPARYNAFITDNAGSSYAAGSADESTGGVHWIVRDPPAVFSTVLIPGHRHHHHDHHNGHRR